MSRGFVRGMSPVVVRFVAQEPALETGETRLPLPQTAPEAAYFAVGTGTDRPDVVAKTRALASAAMPFSGTALEGLIHHVRMNLGTFTDFYTEQERPRCTFHLFVDVEKDGPSLLAAEAILDVLLPYGLPLGIHALLAGPDKTAFFGFNRIFDQIDTKGAVLTVAGASFALGADVPWENVLETYRAMVLNFEGDSFETVQLALETHYSAELDDVAMPPARIAEFGGITGDLVAEFPPPAGAGEMPVWEWRGQDVGLVVTTRGDTIERLLRVLLRSGLPEEVEAMVTRRGRPVVAFGKSSLSTLVPVRGSSLPFLVATSPESASLVDVLGNAGKRFARVFDAPHAALATFAFDGDRDGASPPAPAEASADAALRKAAGLLAAREADVIVVAAGQDDDASHVLAEAVREAGGVLLTIAPSSVSIRAAGLELRDAGDASFRDLFATILDLAGVVSAEGSARSLVSR